MKELIFNQQTGLFEWWEAIFGHHFPMIQQFKHLQDLKVLSVRILFTGKRDFYNLEIARTRTYAVEWSKWEGYKVYALVQ